MHLELPRLSQEEGTVKKDQYLAGLDIGSTKVTLVIAVPTENGFDVVGVGQSPCSGLRKGVVVNIEATTDAIRKAREEAELMAGFQISQAWVGVSGHNVQSQDSKGIVAIRNQDVTTVDLERVIEAAKTIAVPRERHVLHALPREYKIDDQDGITDPLGMSGVRLEALVHIVTASQSALQNITKCLERADLKVAGFVLEPLASSLSTVSEDEKNLGVALVDIGGGTSDLVIYVHGSVAYVASVPMGGFHVTNDVAVGLRTPHINAENLKKKSGCALASLIDPSETLDVEGVGGREERMVLRQYLCEIIEPRAEEILSFIHHEIQKSGLSGLLGSGVVVTGGGSLLDGLPELGEFVFDMPVRRAAPKSFGGMTEAVKAPTFSAALGLILYAGQNSQAQAIESSPSMVKVDELANKFKNFFDKIF